MEVFGGRYEDFSRSEADAAVRSGYEDDTRRLGHDENENDNEFGLLADLVEGDREGSGGQIELDGSPPYLLSMRDMGRGAFYILLKNSD